MLNSASCAYVCDVCVCPCIQCNEIHARWNAFRSDPGRSSTGSASTTCCRGRTVGVRSRRGKQSLTSSSEKFFKEILQLYPAPRTMSRNFFVVFEPKKNVKRENKPSVWSWILGLGKRTTDRVISENDFDVEQASRSDLIPYELHWLRCIWSCPGVAAVCFAFLGDVFDGSHEMTRFSKVPSALLMFWCSPSTTTTADAWQTYNLGL